MIIDDKQKEFARLLSKITGHRHEFCESTGELLVDFSDSKKTKFEANINALVSLYESSRNEKFKWKIEGYCMALKDAGYKLRWNSSAKHYEVKKEEEA